MQHSGASIVDTTAGKPSILSLFAISHTKFFYAVQAFSSGDLTIPQDSLYHYCVLPAPGLTRSESFLELQEDTQERSEQLSGWP